MVQCNGNYKIVQTNQPLSETGAGLCGIRKVLDLKKTTSRS